MIDSLSSKVEVQDDVMQKMTAEMREMELKMAAEMAAEKQEMELKMLTLQEQLTTEMAALRRMLQR